MSLITDLRLDWMAFRARARFARDAWRKYRRRPLARLGSIRNFDAADQGRLFADWGSTPLPADSYLKAKLKVLRARSRDRVRNDTYAAKFKGMVINHVAGPRGISLQARSREPDGRLDGVANEAIERAWARWGDGQSDVAGKLSWIDQQRLLIGTVAEDGEAIARIITGPSVNEFGFALQLIDPELLDVEMNLETTKIGGNYIRMGIEFNQWGRPLAYHFIDTSSGADSYYSAHMRRRYQRVPAERILHAYISERVGQSRGLPWMTTAMERMKMLDGYLEAALINARQGASNTGFFTSEDGESYQGDEENSDGSLTMDVEPGVFRQLPAGVGFEAYDPTYPESELPHFTESMLRSIASALGVSYVGLSGDLKAVNYSSARVGLIEERDVWKGLQDWFIRSFCAPVFQQWLVPALVNKQITIGPSALPAAKVDKFSEVSWQPRRWAWVDPLKDNQANIAAIQAGLMTPSEAIRERGRDPEEVWAEYERDQERLDALGISPSSDNGETEVPADVEDD